jgi:catechol 2,3-dioxygenase-like lactoylglutathione lyase family enzyme
MKIAVVFAATLSATALSAAALSAGAAPAVSVRAASAASAVAPSTAQEPTTSAAPVVQAAMPSRPPITGVSHIAVYAVAPAKSERFYVHDLGGVKGTDPENPKGVRYYFAPTQFVEVLPLPGATAALGIPTTPRLPARSGPAASPENPALPTGVARQTEHTSINRLDHVAFTTPDAEALRAYLVSKRITAPAKLKTAPDGSQWFAVTDPEGNKIEFVQPPTNAPVVPANPLSSHIIHVGFIVHDRAREDSFFRTILGFRPYWFGGNEDDKPTWISQQVPDGTDWLEYMIVGTPGGRGIPADMKAADLGVLDHFSLGVPNTEVAYTLLWNGVRLNGQTNTPKVGRDAKWQLNLLDPDGTRAEIMEFHAIGKPCCSPFTAPDPQK